MYQCGGVDSGVSSLFALRSSLLLSACLLCALPHPAAAQARAEDARPQVSFEQRILATIPDGVEDVRAKFAPDGRTVAYYAQVERKRYIYVGETRHGGYDGVGLPVFSPDSRVVAYDASIDKKYFIVVGDKKGKDYGWVDGLTFSPNGKVVAYKAKTGERWRVVVDEKEGAEFDWVSEPSFGPDGTVGYGARSGRKNFVVMGGDGREVPFYASGLILGPGGVLLVCQGDRGGRKFVIAGGKEGEAFDSITGLCRRPGTKEFAYCGQQGKKWFVVVGEKKYEAPGGAYMPFFSADGNSFAYAVEASPEDEYPLRFIVVGTRKYDKWAGHGGTEPSLSPDGSSVAYGVTQGEPSDKQRKWFICVGDRRCDEEFDEVWQPVFSPDGTKVAFGARKGRELWWRVIPAK